MQDTLLEDSQWLYGNECTCIGTHFRRGETKKKDSLNKNKEDI